MVTPKYLVLSTVLRILSCILYCVCNVCLRLLVTLSTLHLSGLKDISHLAFHCCNMFSSDLLGVWRYHVEHLSSCRAGSHRQTGGCEMIRKLVGH